jgi:hypothetical protein
VPAPCAASLTATPSVTASCLSPLSAASLLGRSPWRRSEAILTAVRARALRVRASLFLGVGATRGWPWEVQTTLHACQLSPFSGAWRPSDPALRPCCLKPLTPDAEDAARSRSCRSDAGARRPSVGHTAPLPLWLRRGVTFSGMQRTGSGDADAWRVCVRLSHVDTVEVRSRRTRAVRSPGRISAEGNICAA